MASVPPTTGEGRTIALFSGWYYPESVGGTEGYVGTLARELQGRGHRLAIVAPALDARENRYRHDGVEVYRYPIVPDAPTLQRDRHIGPPPYFDTFERWLDEWRPQVAHFHSLTGTLTLHHMRAVARRDIPLFLTVHIPGFTCPRGTLMRWGTTPCDGIFLQRRCAACCLQERGAPRALAYPLATLGQSGLGQGLPGRLGSALALPVRLQRTFEAVREAVALSERVIAVAGWLGELLVANGVPASKVVLSRHGLPPEAIPEECVHRTPGEHLRIGYIGRFDPLKGVHVLIEAMRRLPPELPVEFELRGSAVGAGLAYLVQLKALAGDDARIHFGGAISAEERSRLLASWDLLAVPSVWFETGPLVVLEAFAAGRPVLGSRLGGIAELVEEGVSGMLVEAGDVAAWAAAIEALAVRAQSGAWTWQLPAVRRSEEVTSEMEQLYGVGEPRVQKI